MIPLCTPGAHGAKPAVIRRVGWPALVLMAASLLPSPHASGMVTLPMTIADQAAAASVIVEGTVNRFDTRLLSDGITVTLVRIDVTSVIRGTVIDEKITLGLPGAEVGGQWQGALGFDLQLTEGGQVLVFGDIVSTEDVQMLGGPQSVYRDLPSTGPQVGADYNGNPIVTAGCTTDHVIARPSSEEPTTADEGGEPDEPAYRVFATDPLSLGMSWSSFVGSVSDCVSEQPESSSTATPVGGGW